MFTTFVGIVCFLAGVAGTAAYAHNYPEKFNKSVKKAAEEVREVKDKM